MLSISLKYIHCFLYIVLSCSWTLLTPMKSKDLGRNSTDKILTTIIGPVTLYSSETRCMLRKKELKAVPGRGKYQEKIMDQGEELRRKN